MLIARLVAEAIVASKMSKRVSYVFDTFMDIDRGYFPRNGFIDRRFNPRPAALVVASLASMLPSGVLSVVELSEDQKCRVLDFTIADRSYSLIQGAVANAVQRLGGTALHSAVNLLTGEIMDHSEWQSLPETQALILVESN